MKLKTFSLSAVLIFSLFIVSCETNVPVANNTNANAPTVNVNHNSHANQQDNSKTETAVKPENGAITIKVDEKGYTPDSIEVKKGEPVSLIFLRTNDKNCGDEIVFPSLNIKRPLPVGEGVLIKITPEQTGEISFVCGMNMYKGKLIVQ